MHHKASHAVTVVLHFSPIKHKVSHEVCSAGCVLAFSALHKDAFLCNMLHIVTLCVLCDVCVRNGGLRHTAWNCSSLIPRARCVPKRKAPAQTPLPNCENAGETLQQMLFVVQGVFSGRAEKGRTPLSLCGTALPPCREHLNGQQKSGAAAAAPLLGTRYPLRSCFHKAGCAA